MFAMMMMDILDSKRSLVKKKEQLTFKKSNYHRKNTFTNNQIKIIQHKYLSETECNVFRHLRACYLQLNGNVLQFKFTLKTIS